MYHIDRKAIYQYTLISMKHCYSDLQLKKQPIFKKIVEKL